ncbi:MAG: RDD family protein [Gloeomargaritaceae cyanobacterium C42_A2020_066]|nr:RDD family protein [Gloeomargaritaceae cyanobacterium C42_A2020_066]
MRYFRHITLETPESVDLEFILAGIGNRALALGVDYLILLVAFLLELLVVVLVIQSEVLSLSEWTGWAWFLAGLLLLTFAGYAGYFVTFETLWQGQTPGKRLARIRVIGSDGRPIGLQQATLRALLRLIDDWFLLGAYLIVLTREERRIGDLVAGTTVIQEVRPAGQPPEINPEAQRLAERWQAELDWDTLEPAAFGVIRDYLQGRHQLAAYARPAVAENLANHVLDLLNPRTRPAVEPDIYLEAIYLAYQWRLQSSRPGEQL